MPENTTEAATAAQTPVPENVITPEIRRKLAVRTACFKAMREIMEEHMQEIVKRARKTLVGAGIPFDESELQNGSSTEAKPL